MHFTDEVFFLGLGCGITSQFQYPNNWSVNCISLMIYLFQEMDSVDFLLGFAFGVFSARILGMSTVDPEMDRVSIPSM